MLAEAREESASKQGRRSAEERHSQEESHREGKNRLLLLVVFVFFTVQSSEDGQIRSGPFISPSISTVKIEVLWGFKV
jgi:hypothetical protein